MNKPSPATIVVHVPLKFSIRGGRKTVITPGTMSTSAPHKRNTPLINALARAHRWQQALEKGEFANVQELAEAKKVNYSFVCQRLRLTLLAPDISQAIMDGTSDLTLVDVPKSFPNSWIEQQARLAQIRSQLTSVC